MLMQATCNDLFQPCHQIDCHHILKSEKQDLKSIKSVIGRHETVDMKTRSMLHFQQVFQFVGLNLMRD